MSNARAKDASSTPDARKPVVAIVGRPNVGKSTLFNRLVGERQAIVEDIPGTTRDRLYGEAEWKTTHYTIIDTGGLEPDASEGYSALIRDQVAVAMAEADVILFICDATTGVTAVDTEIAELLRRAERPPSVLAAGQADGGLLLHHDPDEAADELQGSCAHDVEQYARFRALICRLKPVAQRLSYRRRGGEGRLG